MQTAADEIIRKACSIAENDDEIIVPAACRWLRTRPKEEQSDVRESIRTKMLDIFREIWHPVRMLMVYSSFSTDQEAKYQNNRNRFLTCSEYDDLVTSSFPPLNASQETRLHMTKRGLIASARLGRLLKANFASSGDVAVASELLYENRSKPGYMRALYVLIYSAGDKICRHGSWGRMNYLKKDLREESEGIVSFEVRSFSYVRPLILMVGFV